MRSGPRIRSLGWRSYWIALITSLCMGVAGVSSPIYAAPATAGGSPEPSNATIEPSEPNQSSVKPPAGPVAPSRVAEATTVPPDNSAKVARTRAAILPLVVQGDPMPEADRSALAGRLVGGLRRGNFEVIDPEQIMAVMPDAVSCRSASCYTAIARATGASHVVQAVVKVEDRNYQVEVSLVDGDKGRALASSEDNCEICGVAEVGDLLDTAAAVLKTKLDNLIQGPATLVVSSNPVGARVSIDGVLKGTTPFNAEVQPGKHRVRLDFEGYISLEREVTFVEGIEDVQRFELEKVPSRLPPRPWGWGALALGIAGLGTSVAFGVLDDTEYRFMGACAAPDADGDCPDLWRTQWIVFGSAVAGAGLATLGVAILLNSGRRRSKKAAEQQLLGAPTARRSRVHLDVGLGRVGVRGRF